MGVSRQTIEASRDAGEQSLACDPVNDRERAAAHYIGTNVARGSSKLRCEVVSLNGWRREKPQLRKVLLEKAPAKGSWSAGGARAMDHQCRNGAARGATSNIAHVQLRHDVR